MAKVALCAALDVAEDRSLLRLGPVEDLDLRILVKAQHHRMIRRIEIRPADIAVETASVDSLMVLGRGGFTGPGRNQCDTVIAVTSATAPLLPVIHRIALADVSFKAPSVTRAAFSS